VYLLLSGEVSLIEEHVDPFFDSAGGNASATASTVSTAGTGTRSSFGFSSVSGSGSGGAGVALGSVVGSPGSPLGSASPITGSSSPVVSMKQRPQRRGSTCHRIDEDNDEEDEEVNAPINFGSLRASSAMLEGMIDYFARTARVAVGQDDLDIDAELDIEMGIANAAAAVGGGGIRGSLSFTPPTPTTSPSKTPWHSRSSFSTPSVSKVPNQHVYANIVEGTVRNRYTSATVPPSLYVDCIV
jgi:hypothetical protein